MTYPVFCGAVVLTSSNNVIRFSDGSVKSATIPAGTYYLSGDGGVTDLAQAIENQLNSSSSGFTVGVEKSIDPAIAHTRLVISRGGSFGVVVDGSQTFDMDLIGFPSSTAVDSNTKRSTQACAANWVSNDAFKSAIPFSEKRVSVKRTASARVSGVTRSDRMQGWNIELGFVNGSRCLIPFETFAGNSLDQFLDNFGAGASFRLYDAEISTENLLSNSSTLLDTVCFSEDTLTEFRPELIGFSLNMYNVSLELFRSNQ